MSAWLVSKGHIDTLVQSLLTERIIDFDNANTVGTELWMENHRSLNARYNDEIPERIDYKFTGIEAPLDPAIVIMLIDCYEYQSCEGEPRWNASTSKELVMTLRETLSNHSGSQRAIEGYWGVDDIREAVLNTTKASSQ